MSRDDARTSEGKRLGWLARAALALVPARWRDSVARDLADEAVRDGRGGLRRDLWLAWQILRVGARFSRVTRATQSALPERPRGWNLGTDVRLALRSLRREPTSALTVMCTLALGTGAAAAAYAVVNYALLRPVPGVVDEDRLVSVYTQVDATTPHRGSVSHAHLEAMRERTTALSGLAAWRVRRPAACNRLRRAAANDRARHGDAGVFRGARRLSSARSSVHHERVRIHRAERARH